MYTHTRNVPAFSSMRSRMTSSNRRIAEDYIHSATNNVNIHTNVKNSNNSNSKHNKHNSNNNSSKGPE